MITKLITGNRIAFLMIACLFVACDSEKEFTDAEREIILSQQGRIMRLTTITNPADSLFLRRQANALSNEELASDCFRLLKQGLLLTVRDSANEGVGIAAPQVGISRRLIAVQRFDKTGEPFEFYINPEIVYRSDSQSAGEEGCLSVPNIGGTVLRSDRIVVRHLDEQSMSQVVDTISGFTAVIFQHEIDHLDGVLFIDKIEPTIGE